MDACYPTQGTDYSASTTTKYELCSVKYVDQAYYMLNNIDSAYQYLHVWLLLHNQYHPSKMIEFQTSFVTLEFGPSVYNYSFTFVAICP